jgi:predicted phage baseplate assembly protein
MSLFEDKSCGCRPPPHPAAPIIPAGLPTLAARQPAGFPEYREALLDGIPGQPSLAGWRARGEQDLGVMLLESWAYVLDVTGFYDARIAERAYIGTAPDAASAQRIAGLLGYKLRGAVAATVKLAVEVDGADPVPIPQGTGFRSEGFDGRPPQVFEADVDTVAWPQRNRWRLAPVRQDVFDGQLRFLPRQAPPAGMVILVTGASQQAAARIVSVEPDVGQDGALYQRVAFADGGAAMAAFLGQPVSSLSVTILRQGLSPTTFGTAYDPSAGTLMLDTLYPQLPTPSWGAVEIGGVFTPVQITAAVATQVPISSDTNAPKMSVTQVTLSPAPSPPAGYSLILHTLPAPSGGPTSQVKLGIGSDDLAGGAPLVAPVADLGDAPAAGDVLLVGASSLGVDLAGSVIEQGGGAALFQAAPGANPIDPPLMPPVDLLGNVLLAVRGETVTDETLGSADETTPFNSFTLAKKPLVWREDASQALGRRPDLVVRVDGIAWSRVDTLFGQPPDARVYTVRQQPDGSAVIGFGDGKRGARPSGGVNNVHASYRFGAEAISPPAGSIHQFVRMTKGLSSVLGPLPAVGGADAETVDDLRTAAPASALTLGRAVSLDDFQALALSYPGILNASAGWFWDERRQRAGAIVWMISAAGDPSTDLQSWLAGQAPPDAVIVVKEAKPAPFTTLTISLVIASTYNSAAVRTAATAALFDDVSGLLSPRRQQIGAPLFRSAIEAALHAVPGVVAVDSVSLDGTAFPVAVTPGAGCWFDLESQAVIG